MDAESELDRLLEADDADELCRRLLAAPFGWGSSTRHAEAVEALRKVHGSGELPAGFVALLLCSCRRWDRVTGKLIAALEESGLLRDAELDELAESLLSHELVISYPLAWVSPEWLEVDLGDGTGQTYRVDEATLGEHRPSFEPPLRRWAARRALWADPSRLDDLLTASAEFPSRHRDALIHGLLDASDALKESPRRRLVDRGLHAPQASVRRAALDRLCELDGPEWAQHWAQSDPNAAVRAWRPENAQVASPPSLLHA